MYKGPHLADYCTLVAVPVHAAMAVRDRLISTLLIIYACIYILLYCCHLCHKRQLKF